MRTFISVLLLICFVSLTHGQKDNSKTYKLLVATYTNSNQKDGLFVYEFNALTGDLTLKSKVAGEDNPSFITVTSDGKTVYMVNEVKNATISAYNLNSESCELTFLNRLSTGGGGACHILLDEKSRLAFVSNYGTGSLAMISLKDDGSLNNTVQFIQNQGKSIDARRQEGPHVHGAFYTPDGKYILSPDLGTDKVHIYKYDPSNGTQPLIPAVQEFISLKAGNGPRLVTFHPDSKFAYIIQEMGGAITVCDYKDGKLTEKQTVTMLAPEFKGRVGASGILISKDGKFLYASNRGDANELVIYTINKKDGKLSLFHVSRVWERPRAVL